MPATKTYAELVAALKSHLDPKPLVIAERFKFHRRNQRAGETIAQYLAEQRKLAKHCEFRAYREEALRDRLVCGVSSEAIQKCLLAEADLMLKRAQEIAQGMEAASKQALELRAPDHPQELQRISSERSKPCYRCGRAGHVPEKCYFKTQKCQNCWKLGHIVKVCRGPRTSEKRAAPTKAPKKTASSKIRCAGAIITTKRHGKRSTFL